MKDPEKEKFILDSLEKIKNIKQEILEGKKNKVNPQELMEMVQNEVSRIQKDADNIFEDKNEMGPELTPEELEVYLQNPSNFSKEDWALLEEIKKETAACKKAIISAGEGEAAKDIIKKGKKKKGLKKVPKKA